MTKKKMIGSNCSGNGCVYVISMDVTKLLQLQPY
jgi:hypothetical protein